MKLNLPFANEKIFRFFSKTYLFFLVLMFLVTVFIIYFWITSFNSIPEEKKTRRLYYVDNITSVHQKLIYKFNERNRGRIEVVGINLPFTKFSTNERKELLARSLRSRSEKIDVSAIDVIWSYRFAKWAINLTNHFTAAEKSEMMPLAVSSCIYNDSLYAVPLGIDFSTMFVNTEHIKRLSELGYPIEKLRAGITWDDLIKISRLDDQFSGKLYSFFAEDYEGLICSYLETVLNLNPESFSGDKLNLNSKEPRIALQLLHDLIYKYKISTPDVVNFKEFTTYYYFIKNNGVFVRGWPTFLADYNRLFREIKADLQVEKIPLPHFKGKGQASVVGGWNLMISKFSENKDWALQFVKFLLSEEAQKTFYEENGSLPVLSNLYNTEYKIANKGDLQFYSDLFSSGIHRPMRADYTRISEIITYYVNQALSNKISINKALEDADRMINSNEVLIK